EMFGNLAVAIHVARQLIGLIKDEALQKANELASLVIVKSRISLARGQRLAAVSADGGVEVETGSVVAIRTGRSHAPERGSSPAANDTAVKLHLIKIGPDIVVLEVAIDAADGICLPRRQR